MNTIYPVSPLEKEDAKVYLRAYPVPKTVDEYEKFSLVKSTFDKKYWVEINQDEKDFLELWITNGLRKKHTVQIFTRSIKSVGCSCHDFKTSQLGFCEHLAIVHRIRNGHIQDAEEAVWHAVLSLFNKLPPKRESYKGRGFRIFYPFENEYRTIGRFKEGVTDSIGCPEVEQFDYEKQFKGFFEKHSPVTSEGLLTGVNLYDYQEDVFAKMLAAKRCICSMIMGSGKTITSIAAFEWIRKHLGRMNLRMLVIAPKSLKLQWGQEIKDKIGLNTMQINNPKDLADFEKRNAQIGAVTYQFAARHIDKFKEMNFDMIILDEMQYVRNSETKTWKALSLLSAEYMFGLSGTIIENRLEDLYSVMEILVPGFLGPQWKFSSEYQNVSSITKTNVFFEGTKNIEKLRFKLKNFLFSYHKLVLPELHHKEHFIKLNMIERSLHDGYYDQALVLMAKNMTSGLSPMEKMRLQALLLKSRQSTDSERLITKAVTKKKSGKLEILMDMIGDLCYHKKEKLVIFSSWTEMLAIIGEHIKDEYPEIKFVFFTGAESMAKRNQSIESFKNDKDCFVFLASDAGGLGVDGLQYASTNVLHFELPWNPAKIDQRNARLHRIGQTKEVFTHYLIGENSIETQMLETLYKKRAVRNEVLYYEEVAEKVVDEDFLKSFKPVPEPIKIPVQKVMARPRLVPAF